MKTIINYIARSKRSVTGAIMVSILLPVLIISLLFESLGIIENPYFGFLVYLVMAPLLVIGAVLLFIGIFLSKGREDIGIFTVEYIQEQLSKPGRYARIRKLIYLTIALTLVTVVIVGAVIYGGINYTTTNSFCAKFCHNIMRPQFVTSQHSPHSQVPCSDCHMGKNASWSQRATCSGASQLLAVVTNSYSRPLTSPLKALRPGRKTCEECHLPEKFHGDHLIVKDNFLPDEKNTHLQTALLLKVGSGDFQGKSAHDIHWHVSEENEVYYYHTDEKRKNIKKVRLVTKGSTDKIYEIDSSRPEKTKDKGKWRKMDCIDCHNRPTHIFLSPDEALDKKIATGVIPRFLPFIKKQALEAITMEYASAEAAKKGIATHLRNWYKKKYPELIKNNSTLLEKAITGAQQAYLENVFPNMNVQWGTYENSIGHDDEDSACFRCHGRLRDQESGELITEDCDACHLILAEDEKDLDLENILLERRTAAQK
ncbi:MAG: NapC/NirT family cytochrome c [Desulfobia sp.]